MVHLNLLGLHFLDLLITYLVTRNVLFLFPFLGPSCLFICSSRGSVLPGSSGTSGMSGITAFCGSMSSSSYTTVSSLSSALGSLSTSTGIVCFGVVPFSTPGFLLATCAANLVAEVVKGAGEISSHPFWSLFWASLGLYDNHTVPDNSQLFEFLSSSH